MPVTFDEMDAVFSDVVGITDADSLLEWIEQKPDPRIDLAACTHVHPAVVQVLLASGACVSVWPADPDLARWLSILPGTSGATDGHP